MAHNPHSSPPIATALLHRAVALRGERKLDEALKCAQRALQLAPKDPRALNTLGNILRDLGRLDESAGAYQKVLAFDASDAQALKGLAIAHRIKGDLEAALDFARRAVQTHPADHAAFNTLGNILKDMGQIDEAIADFREAIRLAPHYTLAHSNLLTALHFSPTITAQEILAEHRDWNARHATRFAASIQPHANNRDPHRRLRVGYVSACFRSHPVGRFILPLFTRRNRDAFEILAYSQVSTPDALTGQFQASADHWRNIAGHSDEQLAALIRNDHIDILIDLDMHLGCQRLPAFARKPAPVQITYLAYVSTTGLSAMDYRISDPFLDPPAHPGSDESIYTEKPLRLPETYWCYGAPPAAPPISALPLLANGHVTFGSFNNFCKVSDQALAAWAEILAAIPWSRLLLHCNLRQRDRIDRILDSRGIAPERCELVPFTQPEHYFARYNRIDIALDTFPYAGGTTTCDALFMGVPVVTLHGGRAVGRGGVSILSNLGLSELIAQTPEEFIRIALSLARDAGRLERLRQTLRPTMQASLLMNAPRFAANMESLYRQAWQAWCASKATRAASTAQAGIAPPLAPPL